MLDYSKLLAPFIPFISEEIYTNLSGQKSVHLADWPSFKADSDKDLELKMAYARKLVEEAHSQRMEAGIKVRQPLNSLSTVSPVDFSELTKLVLDEVNVKGVKIHVKISKDKKEEISGTKLDTKITPELKAEGEARDIVRMIQGERKNLGTSLSEKVNVTLPDWPKEFESEIKKKALVNELKKGDFKVSKINAKN